MSLNDPGWLSTTPVPPPRGPNNRTPLIIAGAVVLGLILLVVVVVVAVSGNKTVTTTNTTNPTTATTSAPATSTTENPPSTANHPQPLSALLPKGIDSSANCSNVSPLPTGLESASKSYGCDAAALGTGAQVFAYQFPSNGEYEAAVIAYNKFKGLDPASVSKGCPPAAGKDAATDTWSDKLGNSGLLECLNTQVGNGPKSPTYIWTIPADNAILEAVAPSTATFTDLHNWWHNNA